MAVGGDAAERVDERVDFEIGDHRLFTLVIHRAQVEQVGDGVAPGGRAAAHSHGPAVAEGVGGIAVPVVFGRFQIPGEREVRLAESARDTLEFLGGDLGDIPVLGDGEVIEAFGTRGEGDVREIHEDAALAVDHVVVVVAAVPALAAERGAAPKLEGLGAALVRGKGEAALDGEIVEAAADRDGGVAGRHLLFECARRSEARLETGMIGDDGAIARADCDGGGNGGAGFGVDHASGDGGGAGCGGREEE